MVASVRGYTWEAALSLARSLATEFARAKASSLGIAQGEGIDGARSSSLRVEQAKFAVYNRAPIVLRAHFCYLPLIVIASLLPLSW